MSSGVGTGPVGVVFGVEVGVFLVSWEVHCTATSFVREGVMWKNQSKKRGKKDRFGSNPFRRI